ncbi:hypothetical protein ACRAVF_14835 [Bradyrhizobium oligotrophicum S58]
MSNISARAIPALATDATAAIPKAKQRFISVPWANIKFRSQTGHKRLRFATHGGVRPVCGDGP